MNDLKPGDRVLIECEIVEEMPVSNAVLGNKLLAITPDMACEKSLGPTAYSKPQVTWWISASSVKRRLMIWKKVAQGG